MVDAVKCDTCDAPALYRCQEVWMVGTGPARAEETYLLCGDAAHDMFVNSLYPESLIEFRMESLRFLPEE